MREGLLWAGMVLGILFWFGLFITWVRIEFDTRRKATVRGKKKDAA